MIKYQCFIKLLLCIFVYDILKEISNKGYANSDYIQSSYMEVIKSKSLLFSFKSEYVLQRIDCFLKNNGIIYPIGQVLPFRTIMSFSRTKNPPIHQEGFCL